MGTTILDRVELAPPRADGNEDRRAHAMWRVVRVCVGTAVAVSPFGRQHLVDEATQAIRQAGIDLPSKRQDTEATSATPGALQ